MQRFTWNLLLCELPKIVQLSLVRRPGSMPEEQPLQRLASLQLIFETKHVLGVIFFQQVEEFGGRLHDGERRGFGMI